MITTAPSREKGQNDGIRLIIGRRLRRTSLDEKLEH